MIAMRRACRRPPAALPPPTVLFPCPHPVYGKGVLVQSTLWGNLILGPTARDTMVKNAATGEYEPDPKVLAEDKDAILGCTSTANRTVELPLRR